MSAYFRHDYLETPDGARLYFQVHGDEGPGIVLCDGLGCDGFAWKHLLPELAKHHRVLRWHYRGHGRSGMPTDKSRVGMDYTCEDLQRLMDLVGMDDAILFGHSMGVQVALEFHRLQPQRVLGLVLLCGSYGNPLDTFHDHTLLRSAFPYLHRLVERFPGALHRLLHTALKTELAIAITLRVELNQHLMPREDLVPYFDHLACMDPVAFMRTLDSLKDHSAWDHLPHVDVPTLVIGGEQDKFTPVWLSRRMAETIPGAEFMLIPGGSHTALLEQPSLVSKRIERFFRTHLKNPKPRRGALQRQSA
jgi:pimeloyl-ACP methyl ester carboxylesterase